MAEFLYNLTLDQITASIAAQGGRVRIRYGARTTWWTADPSTRFEHPDGGLPCDPRGGVLFQLDGIGPCLDWIAAAKRDPERYGKHGLVAFIAANAANCRYRLDGKKADTFITWDDANDAIDRYLGRARRREPS